MTIYKRSSRHYKWIISLGMAFVIQLFGITILQADNLNMKDANIRVLIEAVSRITGKTFVLDPRINWPNQSLYLLKVNPVVVTVAMS